MGTNVTRRRRLLAMAGLFSGIGGGLSLARQVFAAHSAAAPANDALHVGALNDQDADGDGGTSGITTTTRLISDSATPTLTLENVNEFGEQTLDVSGGDTSSNGSNGGIGIRSVGGSHTGTGASTANQGNDGVQGLGGRSNGTSTSAFAGDGIFGQGGFAAATARHGAGVRAAGAGDAPGVRGPAIIGETNSSVHSAITGIQEGAAFGILGTSGGVGIRGVSFGAVSAGVEGVAGGSGPGVWGFTNSGHAILGNSATGNGGVFVGKTGVTTTGSPNALVANGNITCNGTGHFDGGLVISTRGADGGLQATYGVTSPESVVEDFGRARLAGGAARVELDPRFAALIAGDYAVFPVANGECRGLYIANKTASSFEIREFGGGTSTLDVDYRVVARRAGQAARFARVAEVEPIAVPAMPSIPTRPEDMVPVRPPKVVENRRQNADGEPTPTAPRARGAR
jgi:hypothetical protein